MALLEELQAPFALAGCAGDDPGWDVGAAVLARLGGGGVVGVVKHEQRINRTLGLCQEEMRWSRGHPQRAGVTSMTQEEAQLPNVERVPMSRVGGVYFVRSGDFIKIGVAENVVRRVQSAALAWNPHPVEVLGWIHEPDCEAAQMLERRLHQRFKAHHHRLEWFRADSELVDFINSAAKPFPVLR